MVLDQFYRRQKYPILKEEMLGSGASLAFSDVQPIVSTLREMFESGEVDAVYVVYQKFLSAMTQVPTILHLGKTDPLIPPADVETLREIHPDLPIFVYPAGHAFVAPNGFHADSARLSRLRTLALFSRSSGRGEV